MKSHTQTQTLLRLLALMLLVSMPTLAAVIQRGTWTALVKGDSLQLQLHTSPEGNMGLSFAVGDFKGLSTADGATSPFQLVREGGTFTFEGSFSAGQGAGHYRFEPSDAYLQAMAALGYKQLSPKEQFQLALFDVGPKRVKELGALGFTDIPVKQLVEVGIFDITPDYVRAMSQLGYGKLTLRELVESRIHNLTPQFVRDLAAVGYEKLDFETLKAFGIHGVTPEFIREMREGGYPNVTPEDLVKMRIHGIDSAFVRSLRRGTDGGTRH